MAKAPTHEFLGIFSFLLLASSPFVYYASQTYMPRFVLIATFLSMLFSLTLANRSTDEKKVLAALLLASIIFLMWRCSFLTSYYADRTYGSITYIFAQQYQENGGLVFRDAHSYFFLPSLLLYSFYTIAGISPLMSVYVSLVIYGSFTSLIAFLIFRTIRKRIQDACKGSKLASVLPAIVALSFVSFAYSERSVSALGGGFAPLPILLGLLAVYLVFDKGFKNRSYAFSILMLVLGVTFGSTDASFLLILFFFVFSFSSKKWTLTLYSLIPLTYMLHGGFQYSKTIGTFVRFSWNGFYEFFKNIIMGEFPARVVPWHRTSSMTTEDVIIVSGAYLSLMLLLFIVVLISTFFLIKEKKEVRNDSLDMHACFVSNSICLWILGAIAAITYIGASVLAETSFSDIRSIAIVFPSLLLPFQFMSKRLVLKISARRILLAFLIGLLIFASLRTLYEAKYPKADSDPIFGVEDLRLGSAEIYSFGKYADTYYRTGRIVADYKVENRLWLMFHSTQYDSVWLSERALIESLGHLNTTISILVFNVGGIEYGSQYIPPSAYKAAYNFSIVNNCIYSNGAVLVASRP